MHAALLIRWASVGTTAGRLLLCLLLCASCGGGGGSSSAAPPPPPPSPPAITDVIVATLVGRDIELHGVRFGTSGSVRTGNMEISSTAAGSSWQDDRVVVTLPTQVVSGSVTVKTANGESNAIPLEVYAYDSFPIPVTAQTNASPLALVVDATHRVFINEEFHRAFQSFDPASGQVGALPAIPWPNDPGAFAAFFDRFCLGSNCVDDADICTQTSSLGDLVHRVLCPQGQSVDEALRRVRARRWARKRAVVGLSW